METQYGKVVLPNSNEVVGTGWLPPRPDLRDYTIEQKDIKALSKKLGITSLMKEPPSSVDLREYCSTVENQGSIGSCTAHAGMEFMGKRLGRLRIWMVTL
jgi:C1A family cysteine protease